MGRIFDWGEVGFGSFGALFDVFRVGGADGLGVVDAEFGVGEVEAFDGAEETEVFFHVGEGAAVAEVFENAGLDGCADGTDEGVVLLFVADVSGGGELGEEGVIELGL